MNPNSDHIQNETPDTMQQISVAIERAKEEFPTFRNSFRFKTGEKFLEIRMYNQYLIHALWIGIVFGLATIGIFHIIIEAIDLLPEVTIPMIAFLISIMVVIYGVLSCFYAVSKKFVVIIDLKQNCIVCGTKIIPFNAISYLQLGNRNINDKYYIFYKSYGVVLFSEVSPEPILLFRLWVLNRSKMQNIGRYFAKFLTEFANKEIKFDENAMKIPIRGLTTNIWVPRKDRSN